jgi:flagellar basal body rod protein FlgC
MGVMSSIMAIAGQGLSAATGRFQASANRVVSDRNADLPAEIVTQNMAEMAFKANLRVLEAARKMEKHALDILA